LGQIYTLKGGELHIEPVEWLTPISNLSKRKENENIGLEPADFGLTKTKSRAFAPAFSDWGGLRNDFRTMDWVEVSRGLRFGASSNFLARMLM